MFPSELWHCTNPDCHVLPGQSPQAPSGVAPRCACGAMLKKHYSSPVFRYLDFLRPDDQPALAQAVGPEARRE